MAHHLYRILCCVFVFALHFRGLANSQESSTAIYTAAIGGATERARKLSAEVPGMTVAVAVDGTIIWSEAFGYADLSSKRPTSRVTRFRIGSISKSLTAAGLMRMVERGEIALDAQIQKYVPTFPVKPEGLITVRELAGHLAGIRHYRGREPWMNQHFSSPADALKIFADDALVSAPGTTFNYSTYGWTLLSAAMESAAHETFVTYMQQEVFSPFGMTHTAADEGQLDEVNGTIYYEKNKEGHFVVAPTIDLSPVIAGGGFLSTAEDLVRFGSQLLASGRLEKSSLQMMFSPQRIKEGKSTGYGIGWYISGDPSGPVYYHTGGSHGGTASLLIRPRSRVVIALLCNLSESNVIDDSMIIADLFDLSAAKDSPGPESSR